MPAAPVRPPGELPRRRGDSETRSRLLQRETRAAAAVRLVPGGGGRLQPRASLNRRRVAGCFRLESQM